ncbi:MAG: AAA family ATPase [Acidimicrobiia bacterium]
MRPLRLEVEGFSAFRAPTAVDFRDAELVAFVGPTGSGKSSIVDALTFALYGSVARYDDRRVVEPVIHQLSQEAKVRLDFEVAGARYVAVRIVRRTRTGATTREARLARLEADGSQTTLAGTERELSAAVVELLGVEFEQFTKTCVLPQGDFADFLHEDKRKRQELLRQLLDVGAYARMGQVARTRAAEAEARARLLQEQLDADPPLTDDELAALEGRAGALAATVTQLPALVDAVTDLDGQARTLAERSRALQALAARLGGIAVPEAVATLDTALAGAQEALDRARATLADARGRRDQAKADEAAGPDGLALRRALDAAEQLQSQQAALDETHPRADAARAAADGAAPQHAAPTPARSEAEEALRRARDAAGLQGIVAGLRPGEPCPVCRQVVGAVPDHDLGAELAAAQEAFDRARARADEAASHHRTLAAAAAELAGRARALAQACERLREQVPAGDDLDGLRRQVARAEELSQAYQAALGALPAAEAAEAEAARARAALGEAEARLGRELAAARDTVAERQPPAPTGTSLAGDWAALASWAAAERAGVAAELERAEADAGACAARRHRAAAAVVEACGAVEVEVADPVQAVPALAAARARVDERLAHARDQRARAARTRAEVTTLDEQAVLHRTLGNLLKADGFERWLLQAALDRLVARATDRLRELSGGQFSLVSDDGDFLIRDHRNADEVRSVRTLSGGETFLTSLALALALADDIAGLSTQGAPRIESMFLDEGFGTLDPDTLDVVAAAIEELSAAGRLVGIVTHIRDLADRMPVRFEVQRDPTTSRVERVDA